MRNDPQARLRDGVCRGRGALQPSAANDAHTGAMTSLAVWDHVIRVLRDSHDGEAGLRRNDTTSRSLASKRPAQSDNAHIEVLERLTDRSVVILWQDATRCRYVDQLWTCCRARKAGHCAMTGAAISRDDIVYKPRSKRGFPGNAGAMILASVIAHMPPTR
ncbi:hypothetical protein CR51_41840 [Caballeronia megalochromosomata]|jgi:Domain of unknown function (DUF3331)|nr:hypothetical protein CR51_41840 [Caballeronia megalochromosomata]